jgi:hypothetical protein
MKKIVLVWFSVHLFAPCSRRFSPSILNTCPNKCPIEAKVLVTEEAEVEVVVLNTIRISTEEEVVDLEEANKIS